MLRADEPTVEKTVKHNKYFLSKPCVHWLKAAYPGQVVIQYTDRCNASCAQCGMRASNSFSRSKLEMDDTKRLIDAMAEKGVQSISFTGGEPLLYLDEVAELATYAGQAGIPYIRTGTMVLFFAVRIKRDLSKKSKVLPLNWRIRPSIRSGSAWIPPHRKCMKKIGDSAA